MHEIALACRSCPWYAHGMNRHLPFPWIDRERLADEIADQLAGSAQSLLTVLEFNSAEWFGDDQVFLLALDERALECSACGWWCRSEEMHDAANGQDYECDECHDGEESS